MQGCAAFPWDFPDTRAGTAEAAAQAAADAARRARATQAKQPLRTPQWHSLAMQPSAGAEHGRPAQAAAGAAAAPSTATAVSAPPEAPAAPRLSGGAPAAEHAAPGSEPRASAADQAGEAAGPAPMDVDSNEAATALAQAPAAALVPSTSPPAAAAERRGKKRGKHKGACGGKGGSEAATAAAAGGASAASSTAATAARLAPPLLPPGWWIARTAAALRQALPQTRLLPPSPATDRPMQRLEGAAAAAAAAAAAGAPGAPAADGASAATAPPVGTPTTPAVPPPAAVAAAAGGAADAAQVSGRTSGERCLVRMRVHMTGRGTAEAGAAIHCRLPAAAPAAPPTGTAAQQQPPRGQRTQLVGFVVAPEVRGACAWAGASALCSAAGLDRCGSGTPRRGNVAPSHCCGAWLGRQRLVPHQMCRTLCRLESAGCCCAGCASSSRQQAVEPRVRRDQAGRPASQPWWSTLPPESTCRRTRSWPSMAVLGMQACENSAAGMVQRTSQCSLALVYMKCDLGQVPICSVSVRGLLGLVSFQLNGFRPIGRTAVPTICKINMLESSAALNTERAYSCGSYQSPTKAVAVGLSRRRYPVCSSCCAAGEYGCLSSRSAYSCFTTGLSCTHKVKLLCAFDTDFIAARTVLQSLTTLKIVQLQ